METFGPDQELSSDNQNPQLSSNLSGTPGNQNGTGRPGSIYDIWSESANGASLHDMQNQQARVIAALSSQTSNMNLSFSLSSEDKFVTKVLSDETLSESDRRGALQSQFWKISSNGQADDLHAFLNSRARPYVDIDEPDDDGSPALIYASCFGHVKVVETLILGKANVNITDRNSWTALMWALIGATEGHKKIAQLLLDAGADTTAKSNKGRSAADFAQQNREVEGFLTQNGYSLGESVFGDSLITEKADGEDAEREFLRKMMMESSANLDIELDLESDANSVSPDEDESEEFQWDRCLNHQMFVFQEEDLGRILDIIITNITPRRSPSQKPVPANILFLAARYSHYYVGPELLDNLLLSATERMQKTVEKHQGDMTVLSFWMSNATLLLHYLRKDINLSAATGDFQHDLSELINEVFVLIVRDAERRIDRIFDVALLQYETVPGLGDVSFQGEWNLFRRRTKISREPAAQRVRPPSPRQRAKTSPQTVTSILSSTLFVLDLYDIHSVLTAQVLSQLLYWIGTELFNRIMSNRRYLARTKAMQIRMNVASLEEWVQSNNRVPEHHDDNSGQVVSGESTSEAARKHFAPVIQLLQWLQCFSTMGDDLDGLISTLNQLPELSAGQLLHVVKKYRPEVGEPEFPKSAQEYLEKLRDDALSKFHQVEKERGRRPASVMSAKSGRSILSMSSRVLSPGRFSQADGMTAPPRSFSVDDYTSPAPDQLLMDPSVMLPFLLPTPRDMVIRYGVTSHQTDPERARKYVPTVPPEFLAKLDEYNGNVPRASTRLAEQMTAADSQSGDLGVGTAAAVLAPDGALDGLGKVGPDGQWIPNGADEEIEIDEAEIDERDRQEQEEMEREKAEREGKSRRWRFSLTS